VNHDQEEAMRMSDRIAVFNQGKIEQIGTPREVYENPSSAFVASFLGVSNLISGPSAVELLGSEQLANVRPERIRLDKENAKVSAGEIGVKATITDVAYTGANTIYVLETGSGLRLIATRLNEELPGQDLDLGAGDRVLAAFRKEHVAKIPTKK
jgi:putative spermidine/putrescine transport system ATP-binding protein